MFLLWKSTYIIFFALIFPILFRSAASNPSCDKDYSKCEARMLRKAEKLTVSYRRCLLQRLSSKARREIWDRLPLVVEKCLAKEEFWKSLHVQRLGAEFNRHRSTDRSKYRPKFAILPPSIDWPCVAVITSDYMEPRTKDGSAEMDMIRSAPQCEYHVAALDNLAALSKFKFGQNARFYPKIMSFSEIGDVKSFVWDGRPETIEPKLWEVKIKTFLENHVRSPRIDYLWIDFVEVLANPGTETVVPESAYAEYSVLNDRLETTVCQVMLATDVFKQKYKNDLMSLARPRLKELILETVSVSDFLPIHSEYFQDRGNSTLYQLYMNLSSPYCLQKFLLPDLCGTNSCFLNNLHRNGKYQDEF